MGITRRILIEFVSGNKKLQVLKTAKKLKGSDVDNGKLKDLASNNITKLTEDDLQQFTLLEELILTENKLEFIHPKTFSGNSMLKRLILQSCGLRDIPTDAFESLTKLHTLNLGNNLITSISEDAFPEMENLVVL
ncbi:hypothetical protein RN001_002747 [Aquatica leii]|uniref:Uncharacterized protein n=1 Tax=Aquatica leii TaxID=1421715 RepID=A0AAN7PQ89_9COLE|nr:hypothetical protein RN001_002747 [Aquatica leii]